MKKEIIDELFLSKKNLNIREIYLDKMSFKVKKVEQGLIVEKKKEAVGRLVY